MMLSNFIRGTLRLEHAAATSVAQVMRGYCSSEDHALSTTAGVHPYERSDVSTIRIVRKRGSDIIKDPLFNKGTAFPHAERERLGLRGLLPPRILTIEEQETRVLTDYYEGLDYVPPEEVENWHISSEMVRRWRVLQALQDRNETLFYKTLIEHITEMAPVIYTPTVGWVCMNYHTLYNKPRGMYFGVHDKGEMPQMVWNWPGNEVDAIVVTDGSRILGLGDLGLNGMGIPIGKLDLYVAAGGFHPEKVLPVCIDVGTNNRALRDHPLYVGLRKERLVGEAYYEIMDEFVKAVTMRWPKAVLQFEDFSIDKALPLLERYRSDHLVFNDDIQGTACTALAGIYGALRVQKKQPSEIVNQRVVVVGAGSAGMGVTSMIAKGMVKHGLTEDEATHQFWVCDAKGLVTKHRENLASHVEPFARRGRDCVENMQLLDLIQLVKPTVLVGLAGAGKLFTADVLAAMAANQESPIVFAMSNPTAKLECMSQEAQEYTNYTAIYASGSPQDNVFVDDQEIASSQANNMYIFPGLALGAFLGETGTISDDMVMAAAEALPTMLTDKELEIRTVYPDLANIREISAKVAVEVIKTAALDGMVSNPAVVEKLKLGDQHLYRWVKKHMYRPEYGSLVHLPVGVNE